MFMTGVLCTVCGARVYLFSESHISLPVIQTHNPSFSGVGYESSFFFNLTSLIFACYNALYHLLSRIFIFSL